MDGPELCKSCDEPLDCDGPFCTVCKLPERDDPADGPEYDEDDYLEDRIPGHAAREAEQYMLENMTRDPEDRLQYPTTKEGA